MAAAVMAPTSTPSPQPTPPTPVPLASAQPAAPPKPPAQPAALPMAQPTPASTPPGAQVAAIQGAASSPASQASALQASALQGAGGNPTQPQPLATSDPMAFAAPVTNSASGLTPPSASDVGGMASAAPPPPPSPTGASFGSPQTIQTPYGVGLNPGIDQLAARGMSTGQSFAGNGGVTITNPDPSAPGSGYINGQRIMGTSAAGGADPVPGVDHYWLQGPNGQMVQGPVVGSEYAQFIGASSNPAGAPAPTTGAGNAATAPGASVLPPDVLSAISGATGPAGSASPVASLQGAAGSAGGTNGTGTPANAVSLTPLSSQNALTNSIISPGAGVDRYAIAQNQLKDIINSSQPAYEAQLRDANRYAASNGQLGSGIENTNLGSLAAQQQQALINERDSVLNTALQGSIQDAYNNIGIAQQQQGFEAAQQQTGFNQNMGLQELSDAETNQGFNRALQSLLAGEGGDPASIELQLANIFGNQAGQAGTAATNYAAQSGAANNAAQNNAAFNAWLQGLLNPQTPIPDTSGLPTTANLPGPSVTPSNG